MKKTSGISEAEWEVMKVLWKRHPATAQEIISELNAKKWHAKTIRTLISRLVSKGAVGFSSDGKTYSYSPLLKERDSVIAESQSFLNRLFGGSMAPMVAHFVANKKLSENEIEELTRILSRSGGSQKEG